MRGVVLDAVPPLELRSRLLEERRVAPNRQQLLHFIIEELVVLAPASALEEERLAPQLLDLVRIVSRGRAPQRRRPVRKSKFYGAFALNRRVVLHAIDATPARWRGDAGSPPLDRARSAASSPRTDTLVDFHTARDGRAVQAAFRRGLQLRERHGVPHESAPVDFFRAHAGHVSVDVEVGVWAPHHQTVHGLVRAAAVRRRRRL